MAKPKAPTTALQQAGYDQADQYSTLVLARTGLTRELLACPRERSDMTPCIARDGHVAVAWTSRQVAICVGCEYGVARLLEREEGVWP